MRPRAADDSTRASCTRKASGVAGHGRQPRCIHPRLTWEAWKKLKDDERRSRKTAERGVPLTLLAKPEPTPKN